MEYQIKKEQILSTVEYSNLLGFTLVENKLERNFKAIVQALLLNQNKAEDVLSKTQKLEDIIAAETKKNTHDLDGFRQLLKQFNDRLSQLESATPNTLPPIMPDLTLPLNAHNVETIKKEEQKSSKLIVQPEPHVAVDRSARSDHKIADNKITDNKIADLEHEIIILKDKLPTIQLMQDQLDSMKRQFTALKGQLINLSNNSHKPIKRQSISNGVSNSHLRRDSAHKLSRASILSHSNSNAVLPTNLVNKQNINGDETEVVLKMEASPIRGDIDYEKEIEGLHVDVTTLHLCYDELKGFVDDLRKKDIKHHSQCSALEEKQKKLQDQMRRDFENFQKQIKVLQINIHPTQIAPHQAEHTSHENPQPEQPHTQSLSGRSSPKHQKHRVSGTHEQNTINFKNELNDKLSKIQNSLIGMVTQTEFNRFKTEARDRLDELEKKHAKLEHQFEEEIKKIYDMFINKDLDIHRLDQLINSTSEVIKENNAQADRKHNIAIARCEELKKNLQNLREDVEFYQSMNTQNKEKKDNQAEKGDSKNALAQKEMIDPKEIEDLKKYFNNKLHDQRGYLVGLVRDLEKKQNAANSVNQQIANIWDRINEFGLYLGKKADAEDFKKSLIYLEKKVNSLGAKLMKNDDNTEDARIAKTNWLCLSCDKNLLGYQGKIGRHVVWDQMPLKGVVKTTIEKKALPSLKSK